MLDTPLLSGIRNTLKIAVYSSIYTLETLVIIYYYGSETVDNNNKWGRERGGDQIGCTWSRLRSSLPSESNPITGKIPELQSKQGG